MAWHRAACRLCCASSAPARLPAAARHKSLLAGPLRMVHRPHSRLCALRVRSLLRIDRHGILGLHACAPLVSRLWFPASLFGSNAVRRARPSTGHAPAWFMHLAQGVLLAPMLPYRWACMLPLCSLIINGTLAALCSAAQQLGRADVRGYTATAATATPSQTCAAARPLPPRAPRPGPRRRGW